MKKGNYDYTTSWQSYLVVIFTMKEDEISLSSDRFDKSCREILTRLWDNRDFADVTLATEDGRQISAHKIILTSCSQVFRNLLSSLDHSHPMIYMMGVTTTETK